MVKIAVEHPFTDVRRALKKKKYQAEMVKQITDPSYDVYVVRNQKLFTGSTIAGSLVETTGRSVVEIVEEVEERLQRAGKIAGNADASKSTSSGNFTKGVMTGALVGAATALLFTPKSGKEIQHALKEKGSSDSAGEDKDDKISQVKGKVTEIAKQAKEKAEKLTDQVKEKTADTKEQDENDKSHGQVEAEKQKNEKNQQC